jgi:hypothetical protein
MCEMYFLRYFGTSVLRYSGTFHARMETFNDSNTTRGNW